MIYMQHKDVTQPLKSMMHLKRWMWIFGPTPHYFSTDTNTVFFPIEIVHVIYQNDYVNSIQKFYWSNQMTTALVIFVLLQIHRLRSPTRTVRQPLLSAADMRRSWFPTVQLPTSTIHRGWTLEVKKLHLKKQGLLLLPNNHPFDSEQAGDFRSRHCQ